MPCVTSLPPLHNIKMATMECGAHEVSASPRWVRRVQACHNATHGVVLAEPTNVTVELSLLLRVGGPHPQTAMFARQSVSDGTWAAPFRLCLPGNYTAHIRLVAPDPFGRLLTPSGSCPHWTKMKFHTNKTEASIASLDGAHHVPEDRSHCCLTHHTGVGVVTQQMRVTNLKLDDLDKHRSLHVAPLPCAQCLWSWPADLHDDFELDARASLATLSRVPHPWLSSTSHDTNTPDQAHFFLPFALCPNRLRSLHVYASSVVHLITRHASRASHCCLCLCIRSNDLNGCGGASLQRDHQ